MRHFVAQAFASKYFCIICEYEIKPSEVPKFYQSLVTFHCSQEFSAFDWHFQITLFVMMPMGDVICWIKCRYLWLSFLHHKRRPQMSSQFEVFYVQIISVRLIRCITIVELLFSSYPIVPFAAFKEEWDNWEGRGLDDCCIHSYHLIHCFSDSFGIFLGFCCKKKHDQVSWANLTDILRLSRYFWQSLCFGRWSE